MTRSKLPWWKGLLAAIPLALLSAGTASAQNPSSVDIELRESLTTPGTLEVRVRPNGDDFGDVVSNLTFTIRWATGTTAALGTRTGDCPGALPTPTAQVTNPNGPPCVPPSTCSGAPTGFNYRTYNLVMLSLLDDEGCPWPQDAWTTVMRVPVTNNPGCTVFEISNDSWISDPVINRKFFCSLGGIDKTGNIVSGQVQIGTCGSVDCLGIPGGTALPGTACNDNNACTTNDLWSAQCVCTGTLVDTDGDGICDANDNCPNLSGVQGDACNDGNVCTINDVITANCVCAGTVQDTDGDGICNANDNCPNLAGVQGDACNDNNACTINDVITAACVCAGTFQDTDGDGICNANDNCPNLAGVQGDACNDGNVCTINDVITANCVCAGTVQDTDGDGICNANDNCPNLAGVQGDACNDNNACTINDVITAACVCAGTFQDTDGDGICNANDNCPNLAGVQGDACNDGNVCTINDVITANCVCAGTVQDTDGDGICNANDNCSILARVQGDACDDGNAATTGDVITANCVCAGTLANDCEGVPGGPAQPGTACNDGNVCTVNDTWSAQCVCEGTLADADNDGICDANDNCPNLAGEQGDACDDGDACTINDVITANCACAGTNQDADGDGICDAEDNCPNLAGEQGDACDDGEACTINDVITANCVCAGTFQDTDGDGLCNADDNCPNLAGEQGDACDDGNAATSGDIITANCVCAGTLANDCEGVPGGPAQPGTACDDNSACTVNDTWSAQCVCEGTFTDTDGDGVCDADDSCPNLNGEIGDPCDDGNPNTSGDLVNLDCVCTGDPVADCLGVIGGTDLPGTACDDADACTVNDTWSAQCVCEGTFADADDDGICDADDSCPGLAGEIGDACDDGNAGTTGDVINGNCQCVGIPTGCTENLTLSITLDDAGSEVTWTLFDETGTLVIDEGGPYADGQAGTTVVEDLCVAAGCYRLVVADEGGDGISGGGYVLRDAQGRRLIDASGAFSATSAIGGAVNREICVPTNNLGLLGNWCDRDDLLLTSPVYCNAQPGASGYQFWIFDPHGSYNRRVLRTTNSLVPIQLNTNPVPANVDLNIRVRALVNGVYTSFGRTCTIRFQPYGGRDMEAVLEPGSTMDQGMSLLVFPNPSRGDQVFLNLAGVAETVQVITVDVYDSFGKRVMTTTLPVQDGAVFNQPLPLANDLAAGLYVMNLTAGDHSLTERLIIQR